MVHVQSCVKKQILNMLYSQWMTKQFGSNFLWQCEQVKSAWWNSWDPDSHWHTQSFLFLPHRHLHNTNRNIKESQIVSAFISMHLYVFLYNVKTLSCPGHHIAYISALRHTSSCDTWITMWSFCRYKMSCECEVSKTAKPLQCGGRTETS